MMILRETRKGLYGGKVAPVQYFSQAPQPVAQLGSCFFWYLRQF
jgi:hypothetical protein